MKTDDEVAEQMSEVEGDGGPTEVKDEALEALKQGLEDIWNDGSTGVFERRRWAEETRFCVWEGQSSDGRKHAEANDGKPAFPFENASDARVRLADEVINERVAILVTAAMSGQVKVTPQETNDAGLAARIHTMIRWVISSQIGKAWRAEITKVAQYQEGDAPGLGVLGVYWHEQVALVTERVSLEDLAQAVIKLLGGRVTREEMLDLADLVKNPDREAEAVAVLATIIPSIKPQRARVMIRELRETGETSFPSKKTVMKGPRICAHRFLDDIFYPSNTCELQRARVIYRRQWFSEPELHERTITEGWDPKFVEEVLKHDGASGFPTYNLGEVSGDYSIENARTQTKEDYKGLFEILTAFQRLSNDDSVPGIFMTTFHHAVDMTAKERELLDYKHGKYPFVDFQREILTARQWDSRGCAELVMTQQQSMKLHTDLVDDVGQIGGLPPIITPFNRPKTPLILRPLGQIPERRTGEYRWFPSPNPPATSDAQIRNIEQRVNRYFGRPDPEAPTDTVTILRQQSVDQFLDNLSEAVRMIAQLVQQYCTDAEIARVTGKDGTPIARTVDEIQGQFDLRITFDVRSLDTEYLKMMAEIISKFLVTLDRSATIQYDKLVRFLFGRFDPEMADEVLQPAQQANQREVDDELKNFTLISAGIEPPMHDQGQNFPLRMQVLMGIAQKSPDAIKELSPRKQGLLAKRLEHLKFQVQQMENAQTGRMGVEQG